MLNRKRDVRLETYSCGIGFFNLGGHTTRVQTLWKPGILSVLVLVGCSSGTGELDTISIDEEAWNEEVARWEQRNGPAGRQSDQTIEFDDQLIDDEAADQSPIVPKTKTPLIFGYAVLNHQENQNGEPEDHCTIFGRTCDNQVHREANILNYFQEPAVADSNIFARCGDANVNGAAFAPCIVPRATTKSWTWNYIESSCPNDNPERHNIINVAAQEMFGKLSESTNWTFTETTSSNPNIEIKCNSRIPRRLMALGYPAGELILDYAADHVFESFCSEPGGSPLRELHFADMYYTYDNGGIALNWNTLWNTMLGCGGDITATTERMKGFVLHEIGHVLGLVHANNPKDNWMSSELGCRELRTTWTRNVDNYTEAWDWLDHSSRDSLQVLDTEITCRRPLYSDPLGG